MNARQRTKGLGTVSSKDTEEDNGRQRKNNGKKGSSKNDDDEESPQYRIKDTREKKKSKSKEVVYDETNEDWLMMQDELNTFIPDTTAMLEKLLAEKRKKKVFGRDIFNNKDLTFEPNMNIATPQNYILGPGDAVYIDIYGASQKNYRKHRFTRRRSNNRRFRPRTGKRSDRGTGKCTPALYIRSKIQQFEDKANCWSDTFDND